MTALSDCEAILAADKTATPGEWRACFWPLPEPGVHHVMQADPDMFSSRSLGPITGQVVTEADAEFIALARTAAPALARHALALADAVALLLDPPARLTHGRHCTCTPCKREDWTRITAPCGMHGPDCPAVYAPLGSPFDTPRPENAAREALRRFEENAE